MNISQNFEFPYERQYLSSCRNHNLGRLRNHKIFLSQPSKNVRVYSTIRCERSKWQQINLSVTSSEFNTNHLEHTEFNFENVFPREFQ